MVQAANGQTGAHYGTSLHVAGFWRNKRWGLGSGFPFDLHTVPYPTHWGLPRGPTIFGAVSSPAFFEDFAHHPEVRGAYIRFQESTFWEMALTSMSNRPKKRP